MNEWTQIFSQIIQLKVSSITDSLFKYGLLGLTLSTISAIFISKDWILIILFSLSGLTFLIGLFFYCYFSIKNPDYLRSETYQLRKHVAEMLGDNERSSNPNLKDVHLIMNPNKPTEDPDNKNPLLE